MKPNGIRHARGLSPAVREEIESLKRIRRNVREHSCFSKEKFNQKVYPWLGGAGELRGFERPGVRAKPNGRFAWVREGSKWVKVRLAVPPGGFFRVFRDLDGSGRLVFVRGAEVPGESKKAKAYLIEATYKLPEEFGAAQEHGLLQTWADIYPANATNGQGCLALLGNFRWDQEVQEKLSSGKTSPPEFLNHSGFGFFSIALLFNECFRRGARLAFAQVDRQGDARFFSKFLGLRKPSKNEIAMAEKAGIVMRTVSKRNARFDSGKMGRFEGNRFILMVKAIPSRPSGNN